MSTNFSLREFEDALSFVPGGSRFLARLMAKTYEEFVEVLYDDIDDIVRQLEENPELLNEQGEDQITLQIKTNLRTLGYEATHDTKIGGHTDLSVRKQPFLWIGEAKIYSGNAYLYEGFLQLTTRYSSGATNQTCGALFIYLQKHGDTKAVMSSWNMMLAAKDVVNLKIEPCSKNDLAFRSTHQHQRSGLDFEVRHIPVSLFFDPKDKSGLSRKCAS